MHLIGGFRYSHCNAAARKNHSPHSCGICGAPRMGCGRCSCGTRGFQLTSGKCCAWNVDLWLVWCSALDAMSTKGKSPPCLFLLSRRQLGFFSLHGVTSFGFAYSCYFAAVERIGLAASAMINSLWPVLGLMLVVIFTGRHRLRMLLFY